MTGLLASVTSPEEARIVLDAGADLVDAKDPARGALGALPLDIIKAIVAAVDGRRPVSATAGDLPADPELLAEAVRATAGTGVDFVKVGLFSKAHLAQCLAGLAAETATAGAGLIGVLFADLELDFRWVADLASAGFAGVMLDTADKSSGGLREHMTAARLTSFVQAAKQRGLLTGLAGSLRREDIAPLLAAGADYLGFRTALCLHRQRTAEIHPAAVAAIRACLPRERESPALGAVSAPQGDRCAMRLTT